MRLDFHSIFQFLLSPSFYLALRLFLVFIFHDRSDTLESFSPPQPTSNGTAAAAAQTTIYVAKFNHWVAFLLQHTKVIRKGRREFGELLSQHHAQHHIVEIRRSGRILVDCQMRFRSSCPSEKKILTEMVTRLLKALDFST